MPLMTGNQLKAARTLVGLNQVMLADAAGVNVSTIRKMEGCGPRLLANGLGLVHRVEIALRERGVEVTGRDPESAGARLAGRGPAGVLPHAAE